MTSSANSDSDSDSDADSDPMSDFVGDYQGNVEGAFQPNDPGPPPMTCSGSCAFSVIQDGTLTGDADCTTSDGQFSFQGTLDGTVSTDGSADGAWTVDFGWNSIEYAFTGNFSSSEATLSVDYTDQMGNFTTTMSAQK